MEEISIKYRWNPAKSGKRGQALTMGVNHICMPLLIESIDFDDDHWNSACQSILVGMKKTKYCIPTFFYTVNLHQYLSLAVLLSFEYYISLSNELYFLSSITSQHLPWWAH